MTEQEIIDVITAHQRGEKIQYRRMKEKTWYDSVTPPTWNFSQYVYRVKPKPRVRPYTYEELKEAVRKHGLMVEKVNSDPDSPCCLVILGFDKFHVSFKFRSNPGIDLYELVDYVWADDGSPCGIVSVVESEEPLKNENDHEYEH